MFEKILIAEDHQSTGISVKQTLEELNINTCDYTYYCDHALTRIRNEQLAGHPYELLVTDLSFKPGDREEKLRDGVALIAAARQVQPELKVLVFSIESKVIVIKRLFDELNIDGYVEKGRKDAQELRSAIDAICKNSRYIPAGLRQAVKQVSTHNFTDLDLAVIKLLYEGKLQKEMPDCLTRQGIRPSSLRMIEKRLSLMKEAYAFTNNEQLLVFCREAGFI